MIATRERSYDLAVAYRICPKIAKCALSLPFGDNKYQLSRVCLESFKESLGPLRFKLWALLDRCPPEYEELFHKLIDPRDLVILRLDGEGNHATFGRQIDILLQQQDANVVYFAEDDYLYLPNQFPAMLEFLCANSDVHFISPYDHLDCYKLDLHRGPKWLRTYASHHWRTAASTCLTFLTRKETLAGNENVFRSYGKGNFDSSLWLSLTKHRVLNPFAMARYSVHETFYAKILAKAWFYCWKQILFGEKLKLWVPIPGIATHLDNHALSPNVDWRARMGQEAEAQV
jgi:hypothetical protein